MPRLEIRRHPVLTPFQGDTYRRAGPVHSSRAATEISDCPDARESAALFYTTTMPERFKQGADEATRLRNQVRQLRRELKLYREEHLVIANWLKARGLLEEARGLFAQSEGK